MNERLSERSHSGDCSTRSLAYAYGFVFAHEGTFLHNTLVLLELLVRCLCFTGKIDRIDKEVANAVKSIGELRNGHKTVKEFGRHEL